MTVASYNRFVSVLTLVALGAALVLLVPSVRRRLAAAGFEALAPWLAWLVATACTAGSLIYSEVVHLEPCRLCWFQRITMYPLVAVLLVGILRRDRALSAYTLPLSVTGGLVSVYHVVVQNVPAVGANACTVGIPCSAKYLNEFGFVSIPVMALAGFLLISVLLVGFGSFQQLPREDATP